MSGPRRTTVYLDPELHRALRLRAAASDVSVSEMVNDAVRLALAEDAADLEEFAKRKKEPAVDFESVVRDLKRRGRI
ncbi:MAG: CopG family transcriptional regulator [Thermoanaerobaculia bacterium]